ncbi:uncharacterized protein GIQ15_01120 [Arthroderma uncinatum]|uniref:uncharacterized protein n=1 Tax=Arthroderma uncinatum TaxID=74035 RepID=UPI00144A75B7|nr:uncharacterized protein GIQ15_01120 [Arthroderma uncinatum]KAF3491603.1 hypothetical protein GIQ15_01120 [Arthroderma uncinatum]
MATRREHRRRSSIWNRDNMPGHRFPDKEYTYSDPYSQSSHYSTPRTHTISQAEARSRAQALASPSREDGELPDIIIFKNLNETWSFEYPAFCIDDGRLHVSDIRRLAGETLRIANTARIKLMYKGRLLDEDDASAKEEGLKQFSEVVGVVVSGYAGGAFGGVAGGSASSRMDGFSTSNNVGGWRETQLIPVSDSEEDEEPEPEPVPAPAPLQRPPIRRGRSPPKPSRQERRKSVRRERRPRDPSPVSPDRSPPLSREATSPRGEYPPTRSDYPSPGTQRPSQYTSRTQHPSPGTQYPSPGTQYPSPGTQYPSPGAQYPSPGTQYPSPGTQYPSPGAQYPPSGAQYTSPGTQNPSPGTQYPSSGPQYPFPRPDYPPPRTEYPSPTSSSFDPLPNISREPRPYATSRPSPSVSSNVSTVSESTTTSASTSASASTSTTAPTPASRPNTSYSVPNRPPTPCPPFLPSHSPAQMLVIFETHVKEKLVPICAQFTLNPPPDARSRIKEHKRLIEAMERVLARADEILVGDSKPLRDRRKKAVQLIQRFQGKVDAVVAFDE